MPRPLSRIAPDWWDYTTLDAEIIRDAAALADRDLVALSRPGFRFVFYDVLEDFYLAESLKYINAWKADAGGEPALSQGRWRLTALMISKGFVDSSVPMLLANHPNVQFNSYRGGPEPAAQGGP